jgi:hypothetical protein
MPTASDILRALDAKAEDFAFPGFDNMNYDTVDARLHLFRSPSAWAIVVEELVNWPGAGGPVRATFVMGDIRGEGLVTSDLFPWDDDDLPDTVEIRGVTISVDRVPEEDLDPALAVLVQLRDRNRNALFATPDELASHVAPGLVRILTLEEWAHPDVYGGAAPSGSQAFRQLAEGLETGDVGRYAPTEPPNSRDWRMWLDRK